MARTGSDPLTDCSKPQEPHPKSLPPREVGSRPVRTAACILPATLLCAALAGSADARPVEIEIEPIIILNCMERVDYAVETAKLLGTGPSGNRIAQADGGSGSAPRLIEARFSASDLMGGSNETIVEIDIPNTCTVRGLGRGEGFMVDIRPAANAVLQNERRGGALAVRDATGRPSYGGRFSHRFSIPQHQIRLERETGIDVRLEIDLRGAALDGRYSSPVDGVFAIEVTAP